MTDLILKGGRVIDPAHGLDAELDVAVRGGRVVDVGADLRGENEWDVTGLVVSPGFIDLHSHAQDLAGHRLQALDGVTTSLELEAGSTPVAMAYAAAAAEGRPLNYGFSTSWAQARMMVLTGVAGGGGVHEILKRLGLEAWQRPATQEQVERILERLGLDLADGALGIGVLAGYAPETDVEEYLQVARLAAAHEVPTYTHARSLVEFDPSRVVDGVDEIVRAADETGAHMHYCHITSTSRQHIDRVLALIERSRQGGSRITSEAYPYGPASTAIGAAFLAPDALTQQGLTADLLTHVPLGRRVRDADELARLRAEDPSALAIVHWLADEGRDREYVLSAIRYADSSVASDAMPLTWDRADRDATLWPLPPGAAVHPRSAGTFSRAVRLLHREQGVPLLDVVARCSWNPSQVLAASVPAMRQKGHLGAGADADVVVFDAASITDQATYEDGARPSTGVRHLLVGGEAVVRDGELVQNARPGRPVRR